MSNTKSHGLYSCPTQLLKEVSEFVSQPLASLFNMSVSQGIYFDKLKLAKIVPMFKSMMIWKIQITTDQFRSYQTLTEYLKK